MTNEKDNKPRKRGRPLGSVNKNKKTKINIPKRPVRRPKKFLKINKFISKFK